MNSLEIELQNYLELKSLIKTLNRNPANLRNSAQMKF